MSVLYLLLAALCSHSNVVGWAAGSGIQPVSEGHAPSRVANMITEVLQQVHLVMSTAPGIVCV